MKTYSAKIVRLKRSWYILDAAEAPLGRLASAAARLLIGKDKPTFTPHVDSGDFVIVINASKLVVTGNKLAGKIYWRHSGFPGGIKQRSLGELLSVNPEEVIKHAVRGMLPSNKLQKKRLGRLKVYAS